MCSLCLEVCWPAGAGRIPGSGDYGSGDVTEHLGFSPAQSQLGYLVEAPPPAEADAFRVLLYILSHDYGGRLGDVAISEKGLAYWIDARYRSGGSDGWVSLGIGVDPGKLEALEEILDSELDRLASDLPSEREVSEAKAHFIGRILSASQSNEELASALVRDYLWHGELRSKEQRIERWRSVTRDEVLAEIPAFGAGVTITVVE